MPETWSRISSYKSVKQAGQVMNWAQKWHLRSSPHPAHKPGPHLTHFLHHAVALLLPTQQAELFTCQTVWHRSQHGGEERFQGINKTSPTWLVAGEQFITVKSGQEQHCGQHSQPLGRAADQGCATWLDPTSRKTQSHSLPVHDLVQQTLLFVCLSVCPPSHSTAKAPECRDKTSWITDLQPHQQDWLLRRLSEECACYAGVSAPNPTSLQSY